MERRAPEVRDRPASKWAGIAVLAAIALALNLWVGEWLAAAAAGALLVVALIWTRTTYELTEDSLRLVLGFRRAEIPLAAIRSIEHSGRPGAAEGVRRWPNFSLSLRDFWVIHAYGEGEPVDVGFSPSREMLEALGRRVPVLPKEESPGGRTRRL